MKIKKNRDIPKIGKIDGVSVWQMPTHLDLRGRLFKAYTSADTEIYSFQFETFEHFFTESRKHVFRGMHFQGYPHAVSKIISIVQGKATDFLFDMRKNSETYGNLQIVELDGAEPVSIFIPTGVAHGYLTLEEKTIISYQLDGQYCKKCDSGFKSDLVADFLPIPLSATIQSLRDIELIPYQGMEFESLCED